MTLEDLFSKIKMKDGLTAPSRVEELINLIQKEKDSVVKNNGDAARQWAAIANAIAATENRDCLDLFIKLDGLYFLDRWLNNAQKFCNETDESVIEESITATLQALEKLHIDNEHSISSGIWITVKSLLDHKNSQVQDRAKALFDSWKLGRVSDAVGHDVESVGPCDKEGVAVSSMDVEESSQSKFSAFKDPPEASFKEENSGAEILQSNSENLRQEKAEEIQIQTPINEQHSLISLKQTNMEDKPPNHVTSSVLSKNLVLENTLIKEKSIRSAVEGISSVEICSSQLARQCHDEGQSDALKMSELTNDENQVQKMSNFSDKFCVTAAASTSNMVDSRTVSSGVDVANALEIVTESAVENNFDDKEDDLNIKANALSDVKTLVPELNSGRDDMPVANSYSTQLLKTTDEDDEYHSDAIQDSSGNECIYGKHKDLETSSSRIKGIGAIDDDNEHTSDGGSDSRNDCDFSKPSMGKRSPEVNNQRKSDIELEYGIVDALEVARKVAQEVEREVVDYRDRSFSSSEKISDGGFGRSDSPDSINGKEDLLNQIPPKEVPAGQNYSAEAYPEGEGHVIHSDVRTEPENGMADMESSQVTEAAHELEVSPEKTLCEFDLNQEVCSDDMELLVNPVSTPVSVVSASRPVAASGLPAAPLQFEGTLGWKGIAATSAFRPASPRRVTDSDKTAPTVGGISDSSKQRSDCLDIDLNVAECGDDKLADLVAEKQIPVSSGLHSAESALDVSSRRSERFKLDLNRISDDSDAPTTDLRMDGRFLCNRNGHRSPSPASSSSSMQLPSLRNIDLNDRPYLQNDFSDQGFYRGKFPQNMSAFGVVSKSDKPVISLMGTRVEVSRKDFVPQAASLSNGMALDTAMDINRVRTGSDLALGPTVSYSHSPVLGYNGFASATTLSYSSPIYGPSSSFPYMVDSKGASVVPQIVGSAAAVPPSYPQPPFIMSLSNGPSGLNGAGPSRTNFDLNSGFPVEGGNRDSLGLRQLFVPGQGRLMEEHLRLGSQPSSSSGFGGKRKEPDSGWEAYQYNYRNQQQAPWK
ncbi:uncharacterized protein LOC123230195 [Mangifera indica]|uniref:uncharacterized protein LOC123230195 n=1 Tax=Mangifera indica TaxID=29780 RepID=UPI001CF96272|nr:uncharacterized protein LOC123230195 [Mangifera indica]XP_044512287.1 uncharacterized protein LOC123230195 [Mangifera indica]XP_044512288.1 uncharacterized protein LOC123230195 [Mangifera indica]XP_044512289.1 uncharacterized protein LOC123230195 [Mangifera indica]